MNAEVESTQLPTAATVARTSMRLLNTIASFADIRQISDRDDTGIGERGSMSPHQAAPAAFSQTERHVTNRRGACLDPARIDCAGLLGLRP